MKKTLSLAYYLPQFHEVEENNIWWGKGFTEWTNLNNAKSYFHGHSIRQPIPPLNQYSLLDPSILKYQSNLANKYGIDGFIVWNYWFGDGEKILEKPMELVLKNKIDFNFCFAWANHSWINKSKGLLLKEQKYLGVDDYKKYFLYLLPFFQLNTYIKIDNKPVFTIFQPKDIPDLDIFISTFQNLALDNGFSGIYFIAEHTTEKSKYKSLFDSYCDSSCYLKERYRSNPISYLKEKLSNKFNKKWGPFIYDYEKIINYYDYIYTNHQIPVIFSGWDTSPRHNSRGIILKNFDMNTFEQHLKKIRNAQSKSNILILKSWNEWAEGNILEPDNINGSSILECYKKFIDSYKLI